MPLARPLLLPRLSYRVQENTTAAGKGSRGFGTWESECSTPPADLVEGFAMQERPRAIIAGFGWKPSSLDYRRLLSTDITDGAQASLGTEAVSRAEPEVRIDLPPAKSLRTLGPA